MENSGDSTDFDGRVLFLLFNSGGYATNWQAHSDRNPSSSLDDADGQRYPCQNNPRYFTTGKTGENSFKSVFEIKLDL